MSPFANTQVGSIWYARNREPVSHQPALLLIHGAGSTHLYWPPQLRRLRRTSVLAPDLPGHGRSEGTARETITEYAQDVVLLLDALGVERVVAAGHSMGGAIAQTMALDHADRVAGLILIGTGAKLRVAPEILDGVLANLDSTLALVVEWSFGPNAPAELKQLTMTAMAEIAPAVLHADYLGCDRFDVRERLAQIEAPTLVIGGTADKMTPLRFSQYLADGIPLAQLQVVEGAGHMLALERPALVAAAVGEFMTKLEGSSPPQEVPQSPPGSA